MKKTFISNQKKSIAGLAFFMVMLSASMAALWSCGQTQASSHRIAEDADHAPAQEAEHSPIDQQQTKQTYTKEALLGKLYPAKDTGFVLIEKLHTTKDGIYLRKEAYAAFKRMYKAASDQGVYLKIISATRNFDDQKRIWERKWALEKYKGWSDVDKAKNIMLLSSMPGTSRHHWGTDIDLNDLNNSYFAKEEGKKMYQWMQNNAARFGYYQTYTSKTTGRTGYEEEKWHWSYLPIARTMLEEYNANISYSDITGFSGSSTASAIKTIEHYVNGIDAALK